MIVSRPTPAHPLICRAVRCEPTHYERYRYLLEVTWSKGTSAPRLAVVLKNPSTASAERSDPTIGKIEAWARRRGFGSMAVVNLFALRGAQPTGLNVYSYAEIVGPANDEHIITAVGNADVAVLAWGNPNGIDSTRYDRRATEVLALLAGYPLHVVGPLTRLGYPRHGLLWNGGAELALWRAGE